MPRPIRIEYENAFYHSLYEIKKDLKNGSYEDEITEIENILEIST